MDSLKFKKAFDKFFTNIYNKEIRRVLVRYPEEKSLYIDWKEVEKFDRDVADAILDYPDNAIKGAKEALDDLKLTALGGKPFKPNIRFSNIPNKDPLIESIGSSYINKLFAFKSLITRRGAAMNKARVEAYYCPVCNEHFKFVVTRDFKAPSKCPVCKKGFLREDINNSEFIDVQMAEAQEILERVQPGTAAAKILLYLEDDLVNKIIPGENIEISGILRVEKDKTPKRKGSYRKYIEVISIKRLKKDFEEIEISKEEEEEILKLAKNPRLEEMLLESVAPDIYGYRQIKLAILLQLFGGTKDKRTKSGSKIRDDIHILLVGDPGIAKTRFLQNSCALAPKSIYVSGKSVSGVGLTASAEKDELSGNEWTLKAGALVLASGGIAAIDEFDKISEEDRSSLHEVMESGTVSIAKAGIVTRLKSKTAIISAANPKAGRFERDKNIPNQFAIPPSLMSRFDLIFPILDELDTNKDTRLADFIISSHIESTEEFIEEEKKEEKKVPVARDFLRKYIAYARANVRPRLTDEAGDVIKEFYLGLRSRGQGTGSVPITPRYLEGLIRLAEAHAKMRLSPEVTAEDATVAVELMKYVMDKVMTDKMTGMMDIDLITTGKSKSERKAYIEIDELIRKLDEEKDEVLEDEVITEAEEMNIPKGVTKKIIDELIKSGEVYKPRDGVLKPVK